MNQGIRLSELDALRGLAALSVVLFHYSTLYSQNYGHLKEPYLLNFKYGYLGVPLFFMISGFVIYMTILKCKTGKEFIIKRSIRLYPAYITGVILTFISISLFGLKNMDDNLFNAIFNLTMLQDVIINTGFHSIDESYWSLAVEIYFYFVCYLLFTFGMLKKPVTVSIFSFIGLFIIRYLFNIDKIHPFIGDHVLVQYGNLFIAGIMFYKLMENNQLKYHLVLLLSLCYEFVFFGNFKGYVIALFFLIFYALINNKLKFFNYKPLLFLGSISYSLYLIHQVIGYIIIFHLERVGLTNEIYILIPVAFSIVLATIMTFYIEKPLQKIIRSKVTSKNNVYKKNKAISA